MGSVRSPIIAGWLISYLFVLSTDLDNDQIDNLDIKNAGIIYI